MAAVTAVTEVTEAYLRKENEAAERLVVAVRLVALAALVLLQAVLSITHVADARSSFSGFAAAAFGFLYAAGAWLWLRRGYDRRLPYVTTLLDAATVTANAVAASAHPVDAIKAPAVLLLFAVVAIGGLRQSPRLVAFSGAVGAAAILALLGWVALVDPSRITSDVRLDFRDEYVAPARVITEVVVLLVVAGVTAVTARRTRDLVRRTVEASVRRQALLSAMERYFPEREALQMIAEGREIERGGVRRRVTVLNADIRGFTTLSEHMEPARVVELLNEYFEAMVDVVFAEEGTLISFIGDGILAVFGLPSERPDDAERALRAGRGMLLRLRDLNQQPLFAAAGGLRIGIAIHTGDVLAGSIGSSRRVDYTAIGDTMNTVARLEEMNKTLHTQMLVSADAAYAAGSPSGLRDRGELSLRGKQRALRVFEFDPAGVDS